MDPEWRLATDGRLILITPRDQLTYDELAADYAETLTECEPTRVEIEAVAESDGDEAPGTDGS